MLTITAKDMEGKTTSESVNFKKTGHSILYTPKYENDMLDELRLFNKALTQEEVQGIMADEE